MRDVRALTVRQPYASAIGRGDKPVDNRTRRTDYRGMLLIHAGGTFAHDGWREFVALSSPPVPRRNDLPMSAIVAISELVGCHHWEECQGECSRWAHRDTWHWEIDGPGLLDDPVATPGQLGLWRPKANVLAEVSRQVDRNRP